MRPDEPRIEYDQLIGFTYELFCSERCYSDVKKGTYLTHFFPSRQALAICSVPSTEILRAKLTVIAETDTAAYYGWYDAEHVRLSMVFNARSLVEMCFPYGSRAEEDRGRGRLVALHVELIKSET